jgi:hypothetical protein
MAMVIATIGKAGFVFIGGYFTTTVSFHKGILCRLPQGRRGLRSSDR